MDTDTVIRIGLAIIVACLAILLVIAVLDRV